jgi:hypothetical protein
VIATKVAALEAMDRTALDVIDIDSNRPLQNVLRDVQQALWKRL